MFSNFKERIIYAILIIIIWALMLYIAILIDKDYNASVTFTLYIYNEEGSVISEQKITKLDKSFDGQITYIEVETGNEITFNGTYKIQENN